MTGWSRRDLVKAGTAATAYSTLAAGASAASGQARDEATGLPRAVRERALLDFGWRFHFGHANDPRKDFGFGLERAGNFQKTGEFMRPSQRPYDDSSWTALDLPHDWVIGLPFKNDPTLSSKGFYPLGRDYPETSVGWYRRVLDIPASDAGRRITIEFDGVYRDTMVVFNGFYIGRHTGGYDPFVFDVTDFIAPGEPNVLLVRVDATLSDGWFYEGAGINRHVWLVKTDPVHVKRWGTFVHSEIRADGAKLFIRTEVESQADKAQSIRVTSTVLDPAGRVAGKIAGDPFVLAEGADRTLEQQVTVAEPALWSIETRNFYRLITEVEANGAVVDRYETRFGIRSLHFEPETGFLLNGKPVKIKGTCNHQDHAGLGSALPDAAQYFRIAKLKEMGTNAYRSGHNPPTPQLVEACDDLGMLVLAETRMMSSNPDGLSQFANLVRQFRNNPSVFAWCMGNEERIASTDVGMKILTAMKKVATALDGSRPVTVAPQPLGLTLGQGGLAVSDVMGQNYADQQAQAYHKLHPDIPMMGTENVSAVATRGVYAQDAKKGYVSSYDPYSTTGRASAEGWWRFTEERPWMAGGFIWTGFDYRGEPSPYRWPNISSQYGVLDTCGFPKDSFYYYQSWWTEKPVLHLLPHWNWPGLEGKKIEVLAYSNLDKVELLLNGRSLGVKTMTKDQHLSWVVAYAPGTLEARGFRNGRQVMVTRRVTAGPPAKLVIRPDRNEIDANGEDLAFFAVEVQDAKGTVVPITDNLVSFKVSGGGKLIGVGNGDPTSHESDIGSSRSAFSGLCMAIVQAGKTAGPIRIDATADGLAPATGIIAARPVKLRPQVAVWERQAPKGSGITGLWRPGGPVNAAGGPEGMQLEGVAGEWVFAFEQVGDRLGGNVDAPPPGFGGAQGGAILDGSIRDGAITFRTSGMTYQGVIQGDRIRVSYSVASFDQRPQPIPFPPGAPVIGPPPENSDFGIPPGGGMPPRETVLLLRRVAR